MRVAANSSLSQPDSIALSPPPNTLARLRLDRNLRPTLPPEVWRVIDRRVDATNRFTVDYVFHPQLLQRIITRMTQYNVMQDAQDPNVIRVLPPAFVPDQIAQYLNFDLAIYAPNVHSTIFLSEARADRPTALEAVRIFNDVQNNIVGVSSDLAHWKNVLMVSMDIRREGDETVDSPHLPRPARLTASLRVIMTGLTKLLSP